MKKIFAFIAGLAILATAASASAEPWRFGVISDTQWTKADDGKNPNTCAADIIKQIDRQFIAENVKLVIHVGDMVDSGSQVNDYTRALYAQDLYNARIGFYPLRGNHEAAHGTYTGSGEDLPHAYPQIVPGPVQGINNHTPDDITTTLIPALDLSLNPPAEKTRTRTFKVGCHFSAPDTNDYTGGVSHAFQYKNVTFMLLDQFMSPDYYTRYIPDQQPWIDETLSNRPPATHAFADADNFDTPHLHPPQLVRVLHDHHHPSRITLSRLPLFKGWTTPNVSIFHCCLRKRGFKIRPGLLPR